MQNDFFTWISSFPRKSTIKIVCTDLRYQKNPRCPNCKHLLFFCMPFNRLLSAGMHEATEKLIGCNQQSINQGIKQSMKEQTTRGVRPGAETTCSPRWRRRAWRPKLPREKKASVRVKVPDRMQKSSQLQPPNGGKKQKPATWRGAARNRFPNWDEVIISQSLNCPALVFGLSARNNVEF